MYKNEYTKGIENRVMNLYNNNANFTRANHEEPELFTMNPFLNAEHARSAKVATIRDSGFGEINFPTNPNPSSVPDVDMVMEGNGIFDSIKNAIQSEVLPDLNLLKQNAGMSIGFGKKRGRKPNKKVVIQELKDKLEEAKSSMEKKKRGRKAKGGSLLGDILGLGKQTEQDKKDEKLSMELKGIKDAVENKKGGGLLEIFGLGKQAEKKKRGRKAKGGSLLGDILGLGKQTEQDKKDEKISMELKGIKDAVEQKKRGRKAKGGSLLGDILGLGKQQNLNAKKMQDKLNEVDDKKQGGSLLGDIFGLGKQKMSAKGIKIMKKAKGGYASNSVIGGAIIPESLKTKGGAKREPNAYFKLVKELRDKNPDLKKAPAKKIAEYIKKNNLYNKK